ncbi:hypothetical protein [Curtobacterium flaccumfaciens]|uniref:hypothetical protein n=1 Tax=Curtobacterium flaccumfaciens TaxID=2035 RepID=UPI001BDDE196|nr:hypothetical protein [Curtobacterium flaccumfaciens]MBT1671942.1 hypothetical protein [Curtobacterium flaccumfaciens pv. flaccumfaciens]
MAEPATRMSVKLEDEVAAIEGVSRLYANSIFASLADLLRRDGGGNSRVMMREGVVTVTIGTAPGSIARDVAHEVHEVVCTFLRANDLPLTRVDITIATIGI